nr:hypothetical protein [Acinetobacter gerneri]
MKKNKYNYSIISSYCPKMYFIQYLKKKIYKLLNKLQERKYNSHWYIRFGWIDPNQDIKSQIQNLYEIHPTSSDYLYADGFYAQHENREYIFIEEINNTHPDGFISVIEIFKDGTYTQPQPIMKLDYHLSFPCVFKIAEEWYMVPESFKNHTIELWKSNKFPYEWEKHSNLMEDVIAVDSIPFFHEGYWYLFTSLRQKCKKFGNHLDLFYTEDLLNPDWKAHPQNPVCKGLLNQRMAGIPFYHNDKLIRPVQNSLKRYGAELELREIIELSPTQYSEKFIEKISSEWNKLDDGCHTLNIVNNFIIMDAIRLSSKMNTSTIKTNSALKI